MYFPVLRWKGGEKKCITNIEEKVDNLRVIWWVTNSSHISDCYAKILSESDSLSYVDLSRINVDQIQLNQLFPQMLESKKGTVLSLNQTSFLSLEKLKKIAPKLIVRISGTLSQINSPSNSDLIKRSLMNFTDINVNPIIQFDLGSLNPDDLKLYGLDYIKKLQNIIPTEIDKCIFSGGSFPVAISDILGQNYIPRICKQVIENIVQKISQVNAFYSDYGVVNPAWVEQSGGGGAPFANIRYMHRDTWMILRDDESGRDASIALAELLIETSEYLTFGPKFSWADKCWYIKATKGEKPGGPTEHIAEAQNHHIFAVLAGH